MRRARIEAAAFSLTVAAVIALTIILGAAAYVAELRGILRPGAAAAVALVGFAVVAALVILGLFDRSNDASLWRGVLRAHFGGRALRDPEVARQADLAVEFRRRLAEAEAKAGRTGVALVQEPLGALDSWLDGIARLAQRVGGLAEEARFHARLADEARARLCEIETQAALTADAATARQLRATAEGLSGQIRTNERFVHFVHGGHLRLEHAVAALGTITAQLVMALSRGEDPVGSAGLETRIGEEIDALEGLLLAFDRVSAPGAGLAHATPA